MVLAIEGGTHVEMRSESELLLESVTNETHIRLNKGSIIVSAEPERSSSFRVVTRDMVASIAGSTSMLYADMAGTRVAVIKGTVQVQQKTASRTLSSGEQMATNPALESQSIISEISWSRNGGAHLAALAQSAPALPPLTDTARQDPSQRGVTPIKVAPITVAPIQVAPIGVTPIAPVAGVNPGAQQSQPAATPPEESQRSLPDDRGKKILAKTCSACHPLDFVSSQRFSSKNDIAEMINREIGKGVRISESEYSELVEYLFSNHRSKKK
jgi:hypothetical protein